jgi:hypothetical protein
MEGDRDRAGEIHLPGLREDQPGARAVPRHSAWMGEAGQGSACVSRWNASGGGPSLLAMILFEKFGQHQPLNRQAER